MVQYIKHVRDVACPLSPSDYSVVRVGIVYLGLSLCTSDSGIELALLDTWNCIVTSYTYIRCVGTAIVISFFSKEQAPAPGSRSVFQCRFFYPQHGTSSQGSWCNTKDAGVWSSTGTGIRSYRDGSCESCHHGATALSCPSGYRQPRASTALKHLISQPSSAKERADMMMPVWEQAKRDSGLWAFATLGLLS